MVGSVAVRAIFSLLILGIYLILKNGSGFILDIPEN